MRYEVVPASIRHVKPLAADLRPETCLGLRLFNINPRRALRIAFGSSRYRHSAVCDGRPIAMWGASGMALSDHAFAWLAVGNMAASMPVSVFRCARSELSAMKSRCDVLYATILAADAKADRFARRLGFEFVENMPNGMALMSFGV